MNPVVRKVPIRRYKNYETLQKRVSNIIKKAGNSEPRLIFSMYEGDDLDKPLKAPDFRNVFSNGQCVFFREECGVRATYLPISSPTWEEVLVIANTLADEDHVYLEGIVQLEDGTFRLVYGS